MPSVKAAIHPTNSPQRPWKGRCGGQDAIALAQDISPAHARRCRAVARDMRWRSFASKRTGVFANDIELTINVGTITTALDIAGGDTKQFLNYYELMLAKCMSKPEYAALSDVDFRERMASRTFEDVGLAPCRNFAEMALKFGCDVKYAAMTRKGCGIPHYGPVCFVLDETRLSDDIKDTMTCFMGDSARVAAAPATSNTTHGMKEILHARYSAFRHVPLLATDVLATSVPEILNSTDRSLALSLFFSRMDNIIEIHLHGKVPLSAVTEIRVDRREINKAIAWAAAARRDGLTGSLLNAHTAYETAWKKLREETKSKGWRLEIV